MKKDAPPRETSGVFFALRAIRESPLQALLLVFVGEGLDPPCHSERNEVESKNPFFLPSKAARCFSPQ